MDSVDSYFNFSKIKLFFFLLGGKFFFIHQTKKDYPRSTIHKIKNYIGALVKIFVTYYRNKEKINTSIPTNFKKWIVYFSDP